MSWSRAEVLGVPFDCIDMRGAVDAVEGILGGAPGGTVLAVNPEKVISARANPLLLAALRDARLLIPDGIGVVAASWLLGLCRVSRVPGSELMPQLCALAARKGYKVFMFGAKDEVNAEAVAVLERRYPGLDVVGRHHGYVGDAENAALIREINDSGAEILFVALGSPKQEIWMHQNMPGLRVRVAQGVGGTFDVLAGRVRRAPSWAIQLRIEWLYRLVTDPRRIRRQKALPVFAGRVLGAWLRRLVARGQR